MIHILKNEHKTSLDFTKNLKINNKKKKLFKYSLIGLCSFVLLQGLFGINTYNQFKGLENISKNNFYYSVSLLEKIHREAPTKDDEKEYSQNIDYQMAYDDYIKMANVPQSSMSLLSKGEYFRLVNSTNMPENMKVHLTKNFIQDTNYGYIKESANINDLFNCSFINLPCIELKKYLQNSNKHVGVKLAESNYKYAHPEALKQVQDAITNLKGEAQNNIFKNYNTAQTQYGLTHPISLNLGDEEYIKNYWGK